MYENRLLTQVTGKRKRELGLVCARKVHCLNKNSGKRN